MPLPGSVSHSGSLEQQVRALRHQRLHDDNDLWDGALTRSHFSSTLSAYARDRGYVYGLLRGSLRGVRECQEESGGVRGC